MGANDWVDAIPARTGVGGHAAIDKLRFRIGDWKSGKIIELSLPGWMIKKVGFREQDSLAVKFSKDKKCGKIVRVEAANVCARVLQTRKTKHGGVVSAGTSWRYTPEAAALYFRNGDKEFFPDNVTITGEGILFDLPA